MTGRLDPHWIRLDQLAYAASLSGDGQYVAVGHEQGLSLYHKTGQLLLTYPPVSQPVHLVSLAPDLSRVYLATRLGMLVRLDLTHQNGKITFAPHVLYQAANDLHSLAAAYPADLLAVGHLLPALALLDTKADVLWRLHAESGNATDGQVWSVALDKDGQILYVGSAGAGTNRVLALEARNKARLNRIKLDPGTRVTALAAFPGGVAITMADGPYQSRLSVYKAALGRLCWEVSFDEPLTALAADSAQPLLAVAIGYEGHVRLLDANNGQLLAEEPVRSVVNGLTLVGGRWLAAANQDGTLALLTYQAEEFDL